mmetsp:Transcript_602/g.1043  ORF Transcript_602/g.1043 Transcript_602/m.1043 type:complete len:207 (+) Transcript_602:96-716(+)
MQIPHNTPRHVLDLRSKTCCSRFKCWRSRHTRHRTAHPNPNPPCHPRNTFPHHLPLRNRYHPPHAGRLRKRQGRPRRTRPHREHQPRKGRLDRRTRPRRVRREGPCDRHESETRAKRHRGGGRRVDGHGTRGGGTRRGRDVAGARAEFSGAISGGAVGRGGGIRGRTGVGVCDIAGSGWRGDGFEVCDHGGIGIGARDEGDCFERG